MIFLHHCCAVCTPEVLRALRNGFGKVTGFWYNPNIAPAEEHTRRLSALKSYSESEKHHLIVEEDSPASWWTAEAEKFTSGGGDRCEYCYYIRLKRAAGAAEARGFSVFSTTLLSSPYQKHALVKSCGERAAAESGIEFHYADFRPSFYKGRDEIYRRRLYMQKYCGCVFSAKKKK
jgi:hypothetical protein